MQAPGSGVGFIFSCIWYVPRCHYGPYRLHYGDVSAMYLGTSIVIKREKDLAQATLRRCINEQKVSACDQMKEETTGWDV